jgi:hypothetical protein
MNESGLSLIFCDFRMQPNTQNRMQQPNMQQPQQQQQQQQQNSGGSQFDNLSLADLL